MKKTESMNADEINPLLIVKSVGFRLLVLFTMLFFQACAPSQSLSSSAINTKTDSPKKTEFTSTPIYKTNTAIPKISTPVPSPTKNQDEIFSQSSNLKTAPIDILNEIFYFVGGGPGNICEKNTNHPTIFEDYVDGAMGELITLLIHSCGWNKNELIHISIQFPDGKTINQSNNTTYEGDYSQSWGLFFEYPLKPDDPPGDYIITLTNGIVTIQSSFMVTKSARYFVLPNGQLYLRDFLPNENVRVFSFKDTREVENGGFKYILASWQKYHVDTIGSLLIQVQEDSSGVFIIVGESSGELRPPRFESILKMSGKVDQPLLPKILSFMTCLSPCENNGGNNIQVFPEKTQLVYLHWTYKNIPKGAHYIRSWSMEDQEWVKYDCIWSGPESGEDNLVLKEPSGLRSGTWEVKIIVDNKTLLQEQIRIEGNWDYWSPAGTFNNCYGK